MFSKNFPLAFARDVPWGVCKAEIEGAIPLSRHAFLGSHSGFCFLNSYFFLEKLENLATLISTLQSDNSQWEQSSWLPFNGSCVCYSCFHFYFPISASFIHLHHLPVSFRHRSLHPLLCRDCLSHPSLPIQILLITHGSSQMSTSLFPNNQMYVLSLLNIHSISYPSFVKKKKKSMRTLFLKLNN